MAVLGCRDKSARRDRARIRGVPWLSGARRELMPTCGASRCCAAAAELIAERGFAETRIADVATPRRRQSGPGHLLLRHQGQPAHRGAALVGAGVLRRGRGDARRRPALCDRLETLVADLPPDRPRRGPRRLGAVVRPLGPGVPAPRGQEGPGRRWTSSGATWSPGWCRPGSRRGEIGRVDVEAFAIVWTALLDGLVVQVALEDPVVDGARAPLASRSTSPRRALGLARQGPTPQRSRRPLQWPFVDAVSRAGEVVAVGDEAVDVLVGVLHRQQPLLDLAPRRQEAPPVVLHQPVGVAVAAVERAGSRGSCGSGRAGTTTQPLAPAVTTRHGSRCRSMTRLRARRASARASGRGARRPSGVSTSVSIARAAAIASGLPLNVPTCS